MATNGRAQQTTAVRPAPAPVSDAEAADLRRRFVSRGVETLMELAEGLDPQMLKALERTSAPKAIKDAISRREEQERATEEAKALLCCMHQRALESEPRVLEQAGGALVTAEVAEMLHLTPRAVNQRRSRAELFGVRRHGKRGYSYPLFQFRAGEGVVPGLARVLAALRDWSGWAQLSFFLSPNDWLDGRTPREVLLAGEVGAVERAARAWGAPGADVPRGLVSEVDQLEC